MSAWSESHVTILAAVIEVAGMREWELLDFTAGPSERKSCRRLHPERLEQVGLVGLERVALVVTEHADHREQLAGRDQGHEHRGADPGVDQRARGMRVCRRGRPARPRTGRSARRPRRAIHRQQPNR